MEHIFSCRYEPGCSTKSGRTPSGAGIRISALKGRPRKRRDPPESPALLSEALRPMGTAFMTWEGTSGNGAKTGILRVSHTVWCAVRRGTSPTLAIATFCLLRFATAGTSLKVVSVMSGFVALWRSSLRGEAVRFPFCSVTFLGPPGHASRFNKLWPASVRRGAYSSPLR